MEFKFDPNDYESRYPKRDRKTLNKLDDEDEDEQMDYNKSTKLMSHKNYNIEEIVTSQNYQYDDVVKMIPVEEFTTDYIERSGLSDPMLFNVPPERLGMKMPDPALFTVDDVMQCVGGNTKIEVVEVTEQKGKSMKLSDFVQYYNKSEEREELLNVLSLEFTSTKLADLVRPPGFVSEIDWIDNVWPKELFQRQQYYNKRYPHDEFSTYPKVQRYCLMSVARCFTDFHVDFGGTSVWYHILKGKKIFWLIPPTPENLNLYEEWILGGNQSLGFFGNVVQKCARIILEAGHTLIIPSGWIHCVYTPVDSLVFGGNFLHSYAVPMQLRVSKSEDKIKITPKYRFPHFKQMLWCYVAKIVRLATGRKYQGPLKVDAFEERLKLNYGGKVKSETEDVTEANSEDSMPYPENSQSPIERIIIVDSNNIPSTSSTDDYPLFEQPMKEGNLTGVVQSMGMEESDDEYSKESTIDRENGNRYNEEGEAICYDDFGNADDGSYTVNPVQFKHADKGFQARDLKPVKEYKQDFVDSLSSIEANGFTSLLNFMKKLINKHKYPEVAEGITRPRVLMEEFERLVHFLTKQGKMDHNCNLSLKPRKNNHQNAVFKIPGASQSVALTLREPKKNKSPKETTNTKNKRHSLEKAENKKGPKLSKREQVAICGMPLPTQSQVAQGPHGFNPMNDCIELGKGQATSMYRRPQNTPKTPIAQRFTHPKNRSNDPPTDSTIEDPKADKFGTLTVNVDQKSESFSSNPSPSPVNGGKLTKVKKGASNSNIKVPKKLIQESHSDSPELAHRSPLLRATNPSPSQPSSSSGGWSNSSSDRRLDTHSWTANRNRWNPPKREDRPSWNNNDRNSRYNDKSNYSRNSSFGSDNQRGFSSNNNNGFTNNSFNNNAFNQTNRNNSWSNTNPPNSFGNRDNEQKTQPEKFSNWNVCSPPEPKQTSNDTSAVQQANFHSGADDNATWGVSSDNKESLTTSASSVPQVNPPSSHIYHSPQFIKKEEVQSNDTVTSVSQASSNLYEIAQIIDSRGFYQPTSSPRGQEGQQQYEEKSSERPSDDLVKTNDAFQSANALGELAHLFGE